MLTADLVKRISQYKKEPSWMLDIRLKAYEHFIKTKMPTWGPPLKINFDNISYFNPRVRKPRKTWEQVPQDLREYFEKIGIPEAERKFLAGVELQFDSSVVYGSIRKKLESNGVIFVDTDTAVQKYPELVKKYFGKLVPYTDNKFAALNTAVWSGGSFIYVPEGVKVHMPLHAFFRMSTAQIGQFERTLIIVDKNAEVEYLEGCTAPLNFTYSLHAAVVEIFVSPGAKVKYSTMQNWSADIYNLVTKRARVEKDARMEWVDVNVGSTITMKYPACLLVGENAVGAIFSLAVAKKGQNQDTGTKMFHLAPNTRSIVVTKAIGKPYGINEYRGLINISKNATNSVSNVSCDALLLDETSKAGTKPVNIIQNSSSKIYHEATISQLDNNKLFFLQSRGLTAFDAQMAVVGGFVDKIVKELPLEFSAEFDKLLETLLEDD